LICTLNQPKVSFDIYILTTNSHFKQKRPVAAPRVQPPPPFSPMPCCCTQSAFWTLPSTAALYGPRMHHKQSTGKKERESGWPVTALRSTLDVPLSKHGRVVGSLGPFFLAEDLGGRSGQKSQIWMGPCDILILHFFVLKIRKKRRFPPFFGPHIDPWTGVGQTSQAWPIGTCCGYPSRHAP
jgi:hypothetical protein